MKVTVRFTGPMRTLAGRAQQLVSLPAGSALRDLLNALAQDLPAEFAREVVVPLQRGRTPPTLLLVNTVNVSSSAGLDQPLADGDVVAFVPPMSGG